MADVRPSEYMGFHSLESIILPEGLVSMQKIILSTMSAYSEKLIRFEHLEHADEGSYILHFQSGYRATD